MAGQEKIPKRKPRVWVCRLTQDHDFRVFFFSYYFLLTFLSPFYCCHGVIQEGVSKEGMQLVLSQELKKEKVALHYKYGMPQHLVVVLVSMEPLRMCTSVNGGTPYWATV